MHISNCSGSCIINNKKGSPGTDTFFLNPDPGHGNSLALHINQVDHLFHIRNVGGLEFIIGSYPAVGVGDKDHPIRVIGMFSW